MSRARSLLFVAMMAAALVPRTSSADPADADAAIERGVKWREQGKDDQALAEFKRAYELNPTPRARAQMGLAEQALGQWVAADHDVREALEAKGDTWVESRRAVLESAVATIARRLGSLEVRGGSASGDVYVDGVKIGSLPMDGARRVEAGTRTLEVRSPGFYPVSRTIIVMPGETTRESIDLALLPAAPVVATPPGAPATEARGALTESAPAPSNGTPRTLAIAGFAIAGASLAVAFVGLGVRASEISSYNANGTCPGAANPSQPEACAGYLSSASTWRTVSIASFIGAGVLGATAVVLLVTAPAHASARSPAHAVACRGGFAAVGCSLSF